MASLNERVMDWRFRIEAHYKVDCVTRFERMVDSAELSTYLDALRDAASTTAKTGRPVEFDLGYASGAAYPHGERPTRDLHVGPRPNADLWSRFARRIQEKADQLAGAGHGWIRIDELGGLVALTPLSQLRPVEQLGILAQNINQVLAGSDQVDGVIISHSADVDWSITARELDISEPSYRARLLELRLPGRRRRRTYVIPTASRGLLLQQHNFLSPASWYANEASWLDWAMARLRLGFGTMANLVEGEAMRQLLL